MIFFFLDDHAEKSSCACVTVYSIVLVLYTMYIILHSSIDRCIIRCILTAVFTKL